METNRDYEIEEGTRLNGTHAELVNIRSELVKTNYGSFGDLRRRAIRFNRLHAAYERDLEESRNELSDAATELNDELELLLLDSLRTLEGWVLFGGKYCLLLVPLTKMATAAMSRLLLVVMY